MSEKVEKVNRRGQLLQEQGAMNPMMAIQQYNKKNGLNDIGNFAKPATNILFSKGLRKAMGIQKMSFEAGNLVIYVGRSNTGKTSEAIDNAITIIENGGIAVIFDLEDKFNFDRARKMGLKYTIIKRDIDNEDVFAREGDENFDKMHDNIALEYEGQFLYYNTHKLHNLYHKKTNSHSVVCFEDVMQEISSLCQWQEMHSNAGNHFDMFFIIDSYDKVNSKRFNDGLINAKGEILESDETKAQAQQNTQYKNNALEIILKKYITPTKSASKKYTNTIVMMSSLYDGVSGMQAIGKEYGGNKLKGMAVAQVRFGNQLTSGAKNVYAGKGGRLIGTCVTVEITKLHTSTGSDQAVGKCEIINTAFGSIANDKDEIAKFCKMHPDLFNNSDFDIYEEELADE